MKKKNFKKAIALLCAFTMVVATVFVSNPTVASAESEATILRTLTVDDFVDQNS